MGPSGLLPVGAVQLLFFTNLQIRSVGKNSYRHSLI